MPLPKDYIAPKRDRQDEGQDSSVDEGYLPFDIERQGIEQENSYSCGVGCFATVAKILGRDDLSYKALESALNPSAKLGTEQEHILTLAREEFKGTTGGESTYPGGLAIASITHFAARPEGSGHYYVLFGVEQGIYRCYCPYLHEVLEIPQAELVWKNGDGSYENWSVNFSL